ncbi:hypothetical protein BDN72DRAFT_574796 [Pluteus cervinus]|uniref:Uncharacterized protein n=1 Tax=Pluteus cervinus TaxID=181527 RepID=A0ACD3AW44_9AGAR|nr:hypothetical protein BDN72DRAFT_574796 [Pluteus cervinus]
MTNPSPLAFYYPRVLTLSVFLSAPSALCFRLVLTFSFFPYPAYNSSRVSPSALYFLSILTSPFFPLSSSDFHKSSPRVLRRHFKDSAVDLGTFRSILRRPSSLTSISRYTDFGGTTLPYGCPPTPQQPSNTRLTPPLAARKCSALTADRPSSSPRAVSPPCLSPFGLPRFLDRLLNMFK